MADIEKLNLKALDRWGPRQPLDHRKFNQPVDVLNALGGVKPGEQVIEFGDDFQVALFRVIRLETDVIICNFTNGVTDQEDEIKVAMPYLIRKTPFDSAGNPVPPLRKDQFSYTFTFAGRFDKRTSIDTLNDDDEEIQVITGAYDEGDLIFGMRGVTGGTGVFHDPDTKELPVVWQDMDNSRMWAKSSEAEEE